VLHAAARSRDKRVRDAAAAALVAALRWAPPPQVCSWNVSG